MADKYKNVGLDYDLIQTKYPNIAEYEKIALAFLDDPFFKEIKEYLENEDYALAKDATKGLYILAQELYLMPLYMALLDIYEDLEEELYKEVMPHYNEMIKIYDKIRGIFYA